MSADYDLNIGKKALEKGLISSEQLAEAIAESKRREKEGAKGDLLRILVEKKFLTEEQAKDLAGAAAQPPEGGQGTIKMDRGGKAHRAGGLVGQVIGGDFKIIKKLGSGGMGAVYLAEQLSLKRRVAVKVIAPQVAGDAEYVARFKREATSAAQLVHPNIIQIYSIGEHKGLHYIAMEYVEGKSVGDMLREKSPMDVTEAANIIAQALKGLARAHSMKIIHRDIKPDNLMVNKSGEVKIADFGLARMTAQQDATLTVSGAVMGTPHYMSPQQAEGKELNQQADIYSLGATFYHMVTGSTPFDGDSAMSILYKAGTAKVEPPHKRNPKVPAELSRLIEKMMARDLALRYATCEDVLRDLNNLGYLGETAAQAKARKLKVVPLLVGAAAVAILLAGAGLYWTVTTKGRSRTRAGTPARKAVSEARRLPLEPKKTAPGAPKTQPGVVAKKPETPPPPAAPQSKPKEAAKVEKKAAAAPPRPSKPSAAEKKPKAARKAEKKVKPETTAPGAKPKTASPVRKVAVLPQRRTVVPGPPGAKPGPVKPTPKPKAAPPPVIEKPKLPVLSSLPKAKKVITVKSTGGDFKTLAEAVTALPTELKEPVRIDVHPGVYRGPIIIGGEGGMLSTRENSLEVRAVGNGPVIITKGGGKNLMQVNRTDYVVIDGFIFQGDETARAVNLMHSQFFRIRNCVFADCEEAIYSIIIEAHGGKDLWSELSDCVFIGNKRAVVLDNPSRMLIRNNIFAGNTEAALDLDRAEVCLMLNIFSVPGTAGALVIGEGQKFLDMATSAKDVNYNCYAGEGYIFIAGDYKIKDIKDWRSRYALDEKSVAGDPGFKDEKAGDFRLADDSKCKIHLPADMPMGVRWTPERLRAFTAWWKGRKS